MFAITSISLPSIFEPQTVLLIVQLLGLRHLVFSRLYALARAVEDVARHKVYVEKTALAVSQGSSQMRVMGRT